MENRMKLIFDAASYLFINKGYARTQIKDIAKEIGLSTGMLYVYFTGKRDILSFILKGTIDPAF
ncbi:MAG: transcriptional regulator, partial [Eubacterium sp.]|nr:transcriptional regulator [Eubacterium sp.]